MCKRIAANPEFIPRVILRPYLFAARLAPIAKKDDGVRSIVIGTIFHNKHISSVVMCNPQGEATWLLLPSAVLCRYPTGGGAENVVCMV